MNSIILYFSIYRKFQKLMDFRICQECRILQYILVFLEEIMQMMPLLYESPDGKVSDIPLWEGGNATGTIELYRRIGGSLELIDRLQFENGLCAYQRS